MSTRPRQIGQSRPSGTTAASLLNNTRPWSIDTVVVTNTGSATAKYSLYHDFDGTTYDTSTAIAYQIPIATGEVHTLEIPGLRNDDGLGNFAVQSDTASTITFTLYGSIEGERR